MNKKESATNTDSEALLLGSLQLLQEYRRKTEDGRRIKDSILIHRIIPSK